MRRPRHEIACVRRPHQGQNPRRSRRIPLAKNKTPSHGAAGGDKNIESYGRVKKDARSKANVTLIGKELGGGAEVKFGRNRSGVHALPELLGSVVGRAQLII